MLNRLRIHRVSFRHALDGWIYTIQSQPNFRFHLLATTIAILLGIYLQLNRFEWLVIVFTINMVLVAEMINTSIESIVDLITLERRQEAKIAKDVSAGMVLVSAVLAVVVAIFVFLPKIWIIFS